MILIFFIYSLFACEFNLYVPGKSNNEYYYEIPEAEFTALGIWTRYFAFLSHVFRFKILQQPQKQQQYGREFYEYMIFSGYSSDGTNLKYFLMKEQENLSHFLIISNQQEEEQEEEYLEFKFFNGESYEGVWIFTYIGLEPNKEGMIIILLNTKTDQFEQKQYNRQVDHIDLITLDEVQFQGQKLFTYSQSSLVKFIDGEQLLSYIKSCNYGLYDYNDNNCRFPPDKKQLFLGIHEYSFDRYGTLMQIVNMQNNYWIDGWFQFTPTQQIKNYNNLVLQIVQNEMEYLKYNGIIPLKISLNYDKNNLSNNGIMLEISSYKVAIWDDINLNSIKISIFKESYQQLLQNWVYFRYLQYDYMDNNAEFYLGFSDSSYVQKNIGQLNLFKGGFLYIYIGTSQLNPTRFLGKLTNFNFQTCLKSYPPAQKVCHITCLTCIGPMEYNCLTCRDQEQNNRIFNTLTKTCNCKAEYFAPKGQVQCMEIQYIMKSTTFNQISIQQSEIQPCKKGQFQKLVGSLIKCYDCPQQSQSRLFCADCLENIWVWQYDMRCTYDYQQYEGNENNSFIKYSRQYEVYQFQDDQLQVCQKCTIECTQNCKYCWDSDWCEECMDGFGVNDGDCVSCIDNCLTCKGYDFCQQCIDGFTIGYDYDCLQCGPNCLICDYDRQQNIVKCRVCKYSGYFLPFDAFDCVQNTIENCQVQYQQQIQYYNQNDLGNINLAFEYNIKTTLLNKDIPSSRHIIGQIITNNCALCDPGYMNGDTYCKYNETLNLDEQVIIKNNCDGFCLGIIGYTADQTAIIGEKEILSTDLIYLISSANPQKVIKNCKIDQCIQCLKVENSIKCIQCTEGFYENTFNGQCIECPLSLNCKTCQQQNKNDLDGWKWKIRAYSIYKFQSDLISTTDQSQYFVTCLTTNSECTIIDGQNICTFCGSNNYGKLLSIVNNQCTNCPNNCELCQPRSKSEVYAINGLFNPEDQSQYFYSYICLKPKKDSGIIYNQLLQQYVKCQDGKFCKGQINIKLNGRDENGFSDLENTHLDYNDFFVNNQYSFKFKVEQIETPQFMEYLNSIQIESLTYDITLISYYYDIFRMMKAVIISTKLPHNVFSLNQNKLIINANNLTLIGHNISIQNFSEVEFKQFKADSPFQLTIYHPNQVVVRFKDIILLQQEMNDIQIMITNPSVIEYQNFTIKTIQKSNSSSNNTISYVYTNTSNVRELRILMDNLFLVNGTFYNDDFLNIKADSKISNVIINISNSVIDSKFYNSSFIKESSVTNFGQINLENVTFNVQVEQSSLINLNGQLNLISNSVNLIGNFQSSNFIRANQLNIANSSIYNTSLNNSTLIDNKVLKQDNQIDIHQIDNLIFQRIQYDIQSNFITLIDKNLQDSFLIQKILIIDCQFMNPYLAKSQQRLIIFEGLFFELINSHFQKNILGITEIYIQSCQQAIIDKVRVVGTNIQGLQKEFYCFQDLVKISSQNGFIEMENIQSVQLSNSQFSSIMIQNQPIVRILCFDSSLSLKIEVSNTNFTNNLLLKTEQSSWNSIFQLTSLGAGSFEAMNVQFTENILNEYQQTQFSNSATTFLIETEQFNINLTNAVFDRNQIFNSSDSILYIKAKTILIQHSTFTKSNIYDDFILRFIIWGSSSESNNFFQENLQEIFPILSAGANAKFVADNLLIQFCQFSNSIAQQGSGFHLTLKDQLSIQDTTFIGLRNKLDKDESQGGSIYINLIAFNAVIEIKNSHFENTSSLYDGGAIYINSRYTTSNISLSQITVYNCYSFRGTFISVYLNKYSIINITKITVKNTLQGFKNYLGQFYVLNENQVQQFQTSSAIFYIQYGQLYISNSIISDIQLSGLLYFYSASNLYIQGLVIQNIQSGSLGLMQIYPASNINMTILIQNVKIRNCNNVQPQKVICQYDQIYFYDNFQCQNFDNRPTSLSPYPQDYQAKANCFYNKLLDFTSSTNMIYIDLIQTTDYFYITELNMRNNNCSLCDNGMIRIKNVAINTPEQNNIILKNLQFEQNICGSGCLVISQQQDINFPTRRLLQNILYQSRFNIPFTVTLEQSDFFNNYAINGIIIVSNLSLSVTDAKFIKNTGFQLSGGILFLGNQNHSFQMMTSEISDSIGNKGGALFLGNKTISSPNLLQILLSSNKATSFGQDIVDTPQELTVSFDSGKTFQQVNQIQKTPTIIKEIVVKPYRILGNNTLQQFITLPSGQNIKNYKYYDEKLKEFTPYNLSLRVIALNNLKQQMFNLSNSYCTIQKRKINISKYDNDPFEVLVQRKSFNTESQDYNLDELIINFDPYQPYDYVLQLQFLPYNIMGYSNNYELRMNIKTFKCQRGESYNAQQGTCILCDSDQSQYSVVIKASKCSLQDEITMKSVKSTLIELRESYWRPYDDNNIVTYCYNFPVNCKGGWSSGDESCSQGHIGALCEQCDLYNIRGAGSFARGGQFNCNSCSDLSMNTLQIFIITIWTILSILLSVKGNVDNVDEQVNRMKGIKAGFVCVYIEKVKTSVLIKILTNYLQIISSIGTFQLQLSPEINGIFTFSGNPIKSVMYALDCFLIQISNIQILYFRNIWFLFMPIYYATIIFLIYFLLVKIKYLKFKITVLSTTLIFIFIYVQPDIIGSFISLLSYRNISQVLWVQGNVSYLYLTTQHAKWLLTFVVPILLVFGFIIPIILYIKIHKYKDKLNEIVVLRIYGYLYNEYSKVTYYWEIIKIYQKELIITFLTFYEDTIIIKGSIVVLIIFCYDISSRRYRPYKRIDLNTLDSQSSNICGISIVLGMAIYFAEQNGNTEILWLFYIFMGIFNFSFIIKLISLLIMGYLEKFTEQLNQLRDYIKENLPYIALKYPQLSKYLENSKVRQKRVSQRFQKLRKYLWKKVEENRKNKKIDSDLNQEIDSKELKLDSNNRILRDQSIFQSNQVYNDQSIILSQDIDQEKINNSLDIQILDNRQALYQNVQYEKPNQQNNQDESIKKNSQSYVPLSLNFDILHSEQDQQNNQDEENSQFQE